MRSNENKKKSLKRRGSLPSSFQCNSTTASSPNAPRKSRINPIDNAQSNINKTGSPFRILFEMMAEGVLFQDYKGRITSANPSAERILGMSTKQLQGLTFPDPRWDFIREDGSFVPKEEHPSILALRTGKPVSGVIMGVRHLQSGEYRWIIINAIPVSQPGGADIRQVYTTFSDITERKRYEDILKESEMKYRIIFERASNSIVLIDDKTGGYMEFNDRACEELGYTREEFAALKITDVNAVETNDEYKRHAEKIKKEGIDIFETKHRAKSSEIRDILLSVTPLDIGNDKFTLSIGYDITERKQAEEKLRRSEEMFSKTFEISPNLMAITAYKDGRILEVNEAFYRTFGYKREECIGRTMMQLKIWDNRRQRKTLIRKVDENEKIINHEIKLCNKSGKIKILNFSAVKITLNGEPCLISIANDITERKRAEKALEESEARMYAIRSSIPDLITTLDKEGRYKDILAGIDDVFYIEKGKISGRLISDILPKDIAESGLAAIKRALETNTTQTIEYQLTLSSGKRWFEGKISPALSTVKGEKLVVMVTRDITEQKKLKEEQQRIERLESLGILAGGIAHDFNNILTGIIGNISLARRDIDTGSKIADKLQEAEKASFRARDLTHRLLTFAQGGAPVKRTISIAEIIREATGFALRGSNVKCIYSLSDSLWPVEADEGQMNQVFINLVINACEAMPGGGILDISARNITVKKTESAALPAGKLVKITVADHGTGISKKNLGKIFEPYFTTKQKGSGLGLASAYSIIKSHNGHITVESEPGLGTTFNIYFHASGNTLTKKSEIAQELPVAGKGKILVMDDEEAIRLLLTKILTRIGYEVDLVQDGEEAIKRFSAAWTAGKPFAAVIMDLTIPGGMGGKEAVKKLREIDANVNVIVSSGYSTDPIMADYRKYGFSGVVAKPYQPGQIEKTLQQILIGADNNPPLKLNNTGY